MDTNRSTQVILHWLLITYIFLLPLFFLPNIINSFNLAKVVLTLFFCTCMLFIVAIDTLKTKKLLLKLKASDLPILAIVTAYTLSTIIQSTNIPAALTERTFFVISSALIYFIASNYLDRSKAQSLVYSLIISITVSSIFILLQSTGIFKSIYLLKDLGQSTTGTPFSLTIANLIVLGMSIGFLIKSHSLSPKILLSICVFINGSSLMFFLYQLISNKLTFLNLPYLIGYQIALDILKLPRSALLGIGPENFQSAFTILKPISYNTHENLWSFRLTTSSNELFHISTTTGIAGAIALGLIIIYLIKSIYSHRLNLGITIGTIILLLSLLVYTSTITLLGILFFTVIVHSLLDDNNPTKEVPAPFLLPAVLTILVILIVGTAWTTQIVVADYHYARALAPDNKNRFTELDIARNMNPYNPDYQMSYSTLAIQLAQNISNKNNLNDEDKKAIKNLITAAIPAANKAAFTLGQNQAITWENRARLMKRISTVVPGAAQEAVKSYNSALLLDSKNPLLHIEYGQYLQTLKLYDPAYREFDNAIKLKPNYANAYFNLASLQIAQGKYNQANNAIQETLKYVPASSPSYPSVQKLKEFIEDNLKKEQTTSTASPSVIPQTPTSTTEATSSAQPDESILTPGSLNSDEAQDIELNDAKQPNQPESILLISPTPSPTQVLTP